MEIEDYTKEALKKRIIELELTIGTLVGAYARGGLSHELWEKAAKQIGCLPAFVSLEDN